MFLPEKKLYFDEVLFTMRDDYVIEVFTKQDIDLGYYWSIIKIRCSPCQNDYIRSNVGFGYAKTRQKAFEDACEYYDKFVNI